MVMVEVTVMILPFKEETVEATWRPRVMAMVEERLALRVAVAVMVRPAEEKKDEMVMLAAQTAAVQVRPAEEKKDQKVMLAAQERVTVAVLVSPAEEKKGGGGPPSGAAKGEAGRRKTRSKR